MLLVNHAKDCLNSGERKMTDIDSKVSWDDLCLLSHKNALLNAIMMKIEMREVSKEEGLLIAVKNLIEQNEDLFNKLVDKKASEPMRIAVSGIQETRCVMNIPESELISDKLNPDFVELNGSKGTIVEHSLEESKSKYVFFDGQIESAAFLVPEKWLIRQPIKKEKNP